MTNYQETIAQILEHYYRSDYDHVDLRHIEAWMRVGHDTLDGLSAEEMRRETRIALGCIEESGPETSEDLARSMGL